MWVHGWWWKHVSDFENLELFCAVCGRDFEEFDVFYTARCPTDEEVEAVQLVFDVDIFCEFDVCCQCVSDTPFTEWIEEQLEKQKLKVRRARHDWMGDGF